MLVKVLAVISSLALAIDALLVLPPTLPDLSVDLSGNFYLNGIEHKSHAVSVSCADCQLSSDRLPYGDSAESTLSEPLVLNFTVVPGDPDSLAVNGVPIYPLSIDDLTLRLPQVEIKAAQSGIQRTVPLTYGLDYIFAMASRDTPADSIKLIFRIVEIDDLPVVGVDNVEITLMRANFGPLKIFSARVVHSARSHGASHSGKGEVEEVKECSLSPALCKLRAIVAGKLANIRKPGKGCHRGRRPGTVGSEETISRYPTGDDRAHGVQRGRHSHHHGQSHTHNIIKKTALHVLLPIFIGIAAGMTASLLGMVIGHLVVALWRRFYRGGRTASYVIISASDDDVLGDEKISFEDQGLPEYDEAVAVVTVEKQ